jgi:hypothetical protein
VAYARAPPASVTNHCPAVACDGTVPPGPMSGAVWNNGDLSNADLSNADWAASRRYGSDLDGADPTGATESHADAARPGIHDAAVPGSVAGATRD